MTLTTVSHQPCLRSVSRMRQGTASPISLVCVINALGTGGAEAMLYRLLTQLDHRQFHVRVISLIDIIEPFATKIRALGISVETLGMRRGVPNPLYIWRLARWLRAARPDVVQTWLYHADLIGGVAAKLAGNIPVIWSLRHADLSAEGNPWLTRQTVRLCARASRWLPNRIICNSEASRAVHLDAGYAPEKIDVIPNGLDLASYAPDEEARASVRAELAIPPGGLVIGIVGRFHPHKDHQTFVRAAAALARRRADVTFVLCGREVTWENAQLAEWVNAEGIRARVRLLGERADIPRVMASFDVAVSSSFGESFPNVIAEAMSCGVPCVATDVGDSSQIIGSTGIIVPPKNPEALAKGMEELLRVEGGQRRLRGLAARQRIKERFDLPKVATRFESLFRELASCRA